MSEPHASLLGRLGALALDKTGFGSLLSHSQSPRPLSACERLPSEVLEEIFRLRFHDEIANLRVRVKIFSKLALVCKAWASAAGAVAFKTLQLDRNDPMAVAYFDPKRGPGRHYLQYVDEIILAEVHDMQGLVVRFAEVIEQLQHQRRGPNSAARAATSSSFGTPMRASSRVDQTIMAVLAACPKLAKLTAKEQAEVLLPKMISQFDLPAIWSRLRVIHLSWFKRIHNLLPVLGHLSRFPELEIVHLLITPEDETDSASTELINPISKLKEFSCTSHKNVPILYEIVSPLIPTNAKLEAFHWIGRFPRDLCRKLVQRVQSIETLVIGFLAPEGDLAQSLIPQLPTLRPLPVQKLKLGVKPNNPFVNQAPERMPYATNLLDRLPTSIKTVDATCEVMDVVTPFARNARLAAILARPASHALELDIAGHLVPTPGEKQPLQIVYLNADGHPPTRYAFVRFGNEWDYTEWSHVDIPSTGQRWKM